MTTEKMLYNLLVEMEHTGQISIIMELYWASFVISLKKIMDVLLPFANNYEAWAWLYQAMTGLEEVLD